MDYYKIPIMLLAPGLGANIQDRASTQLHTESKVPKVGPQSRCIMEYAQIADCIWKA